MAASVELIAYPSRLGGTLGRLREILAGPLAGLFAGVHVLPNYVPFDGADGSKRLVWTTFTPQQIDIDVRKQITREYLLGVLDRFAAGALTLRRDARPGAESWQRLIAVSILVSWNADMPASVPR